MVGTIAASAAGATWVVTSISGALAGRSARTNGVQTSSSPLEYVALVAPAVFTIGLVVTVAMLATALQGVAIPLDPKVSTAGRRYLDNLVGNDLAWSDLQLLPPMKNVSGIPAEGKSLISVADVDQILHFRIFDASGYQVVDTDESKLKGLARRLNDPVLTELTRRIGDFRKRLDSLRSPHKLTEKEKYEVIGGITSIVGPMRVAAGTWAILLVSGLIAIISCVYININLFGLNAFYANRLVRCYLGASRPREAPRRGGPPSPRPIAPSPSAVPTRSPASTRPMTSRSAIWSSSAPGTIRIWSSTTAVPTT